MRIGCVDLDNIDVLEVLRLRSAVLALTVLANM